MGLYKGMVVVSYQLLARMVIPILLLMIMVSKTHQVRHTPLVEPVDEDIPRLIVRRIGVYGLTSVTFTYTVA
jgi:hypothetical protein